MSRWFRLYDALVDDPKVQKLGPDLFKALVNIWCLASQNGGYLPSVEDIAFKLRMKPDRAINTLKELEHCGFFDRDETGLKPHNWDHRQYKSDVSTERVKRFRKRSETVSETPPEQNRAEADTEQKDNIRTVAIATRPKTEFEEFWKAYPRRLGANPKTPASKVFDAAVKQGADPAAIVDGARRCAAADRDKIGTPYIPQAVKWLRDKRWQDYAQPARASPQVPIGAPTDEELRKKYGQPCAIPTEASAGNGPRTDNGEELRREGDQVRPIIRGF